MWKLLSSRKLFWLLLFVFVVFNALNWFVYTYGEGPRLSCFDAPGPDMRAFKWHYSAARHLDSVMSIPILGIDLERLVGLVLLIISAILILIGFYQKGISIIVAAGMILYLLFVFGFGEWLLGTARVQSFDGVRQRDIRQIASALELYRTDNEADKYPGDSGSSQYEQLSKNEIFGRYMPKLPQDPCFQKNPLWGYQYWVAPDGKSFVLKAYLQGYIPYIDSNKYSRDASLDADGNILGVSCGENGPQEREFCIAW